MAGDDAAAHIPSGGGAAVSDADHRHVSPNPSELINKRLLAQIFAALREEFNYVIVDCPRLTTVVDTMTLAHYADFVLPVVSVAQTPRRPFAVHMETLGTLDGRQGMIINGVLGPALRYGYSYGYGYS